MESKLEAEREQWNMHRCWGILSPLFTGNSGKGEGGGEGESFRQDTPAAEHRRQTAMTISLFKRVDGRDVTISGSHGAITPR